MPLASVFELPTRWGGNDGARHCMLRIAPDFNSRTSKFVNFPHVAANLPSGDRESVLL